MRRKKAPALSVEDLRAFAQPNPEPFVALLEKMKQRDRPAVMSWNWVGFLVPLPWFAYRKLWGALVAIPAGIAVVVLLNRYLSQIASGPGVDVMYLALAVTLGGLYGNSYLIQKADKVAARATAQGLTGDARAAYLATQGGTSPLAATLVGVLFGALVLLYGLAIAGLIVASK